MDSAAIAAFIAHFTWYLQSSSSPAEVQRRTAAEAGLGPVCRNPFKSIVVRAVETVEAVNESLRLIDAYEEPDAPAVKLEPKEGVGWGASEAPRGMLYHRYRIDAAGLVREAKIVPPTSQNLKIIEDDLALYVRRHLQLDDAALTWGCEQTVRNYDPCISCATHFLRLRCVGPEWSAS